MTNGSGVEFGLRDGSGQTAATGEICDPVEPTVRIGDIIQRNSEIDSCASASVRMFSTMYVPVSASRC